MRDMIFRELSELIRKYKGEYYNPIYLGLKTKFTNVDKILIAREYETLRKFITSCYCYEWLDVQELNKLTRELRDLNEYINSKF